MTEKTIHERLNDGRLFYKQQGVYELYQRHKERNPDLAALYATLVSLSCTQGERLVQCRKELDTARTSW